MTYHKLICYYREQYIIHIYLGKTVEEVQQSAQILQNWFTQADFEEAQAIEHDIMYGRGAYLYKQIERDLAFQREQAKILRQFEAIRASIYQ